MILHVAGTQMFFMLTGKFVEQILRFFTQYVDQHVQATAVRHPQHHFASAAVTRMANHLFQHGYQRISPLERETFRTREFGAQITFQPFSGGQFVQEAFFLVSAKGRTTGFDALLDPAFLFGAGDVHILSANRAAVGLFERVEQLAQLHRLFAAGKGADIEGFLEIGLGQIMERRIEIRHAFLLPQSQRIEVCMLMATETISVDKLQDFNLLHIGVRVGNRRRVT